MNKRWIALLTGILIMLWNCDDSTTKPKDNKYSGIIKNVDFDLLFAEPTEAELTKITNEWKVYSSQLNHIAIIDTFYKMIGTEIRKVIVLSHGKSNGPKHYGAVILPVIETASYPIMVYNHGGDEGIDVSSYTSMAGFSPDMKEISNGHIVAIPSFRAEPLIIDSVHTYLSEGIPSPWDGDVEDCIDFLTAISSVVPQADTTKICVVGISRGGGVSMLWAARDNRVDRVVSFFGPTDMVSEWTREITYDALHGEVVDLPGLDYLNETIIQPLKNGNMTIAEARLQLIRRSPVYFLQEIVPLQIHHGYDDEIVPVTQAEELIEIAEKLNLNETQFQAYLHEYSGHDENTFLKGIDEMKDFINF